MKHLLKSCYYTVATTALAVPSSVFAQDNPFVRAQEEAKRTGTAAFGQEPGQELPEIIGSLINIALGFVGVILLVYLVYGGFLWMTSGGSDEGVKKAQTMIKNAIIGLVIVVAAYAISNFVLTELIRATGAA